MPSVQTNLIMGNNSSTTDSGESQQGTGMSQESTSTDVPSSPNQLPTPAAASAAEAQPASKAEEEAPSDDPNECSWCKWMKGGGCKTEFEVWLKCVDDVRDAGRDDVESCASVMGPLWDCMQKNSDYYAQQLDSLKNKSPDNEGESAAQAGEPTKGGRAVDLTGLTIEVVGEIDELLENIMDIDLDDDDV